MIRSWKVGRFSGIELRLHWTALLVPFLLFGWSQWQHSRGEAVVAVLVLLGVMGSVVVQELAHLWSARYLGITTRDLVFFPIFAIARRNRLSEKPRDEIWISLTGLATQFATTALLALGLNLDGVALRPAMDSTEPLGDVVVNRLMWAQLVLLLVNLLPVMPLHGGYIFRAVLALATSRLRATEMTAVLGNLFAFAAVVVGIWVIPNPFILLLGLYFFLLGQQELDNTRYFDGMRSTSRTTSARASVSPADDSGRLVETVSDGPRQVVMLPVEQIVDAECRPEESDFSGFTWSPRTRLWVEWRDGQPISANALLGD